MGFSGVNEKKLREAKMEPAAGTAFAGWGWGDTRGPSYPRGRGGVCITSIGVTEERMEAL